MELPMSETNSVSPLRQRMIEDMAARKLNPHTQRSHVYSCKRFAAWLKRSPDTATPDEVRHFSCISSRAVRASVTAIGS
jgi:integrase/recombinase XerD